MRRIFLLVLLAPLLLWAQKTLIYQVQGTFTRGQSYGMAFKIVEQTPLIPLKIQLNGQEQWLKRAPSIPDKKNAVHWFLQNDYLIILWSADHQQGNTSFTITFQQSLQKVPAQSMEIYSVGRDFKPGQLTQSVPVTVITQR